MDSINQIIESFACLSSALFIYIKDSIKNQSTKGSVMFMQSKLDAASSQFNYSWLNLRINCQMIYQISSKIF